MKTRGVHLQYSFEATDQRGAVLHNPLFDLLSAVREHGSIQHAAKALGASYRHVWGALKRWEEALGEPLLTWVQGQPARLTPFADRLLWAETRARARLTPHIEALRAELERVLAEALDGDQHVLPILASHDLALPLLRDLASGLADVGPGLAAAARQFGLDFVPLVEEDYFLVCLKDALEHPAVLKLRDTLASPAWQAELAQLPGYAPWHSGEVLSLTQALPWWHFRVTKPSHAPG